MPTITNFNRRFQLALLCLLDAAIRWSYGVQCMMRTCMVFILILIFYAIISQDIIMLLVRERELLIGTVVRLLVDVDSGSV